VDDTNQVVVTNPPSVKAPTMKSPGTTTTETTS